MIVWLLLGACKNGPINPDIGGPFVAVANIINCYFASNTVLSPIQFYLLLS